MYIRINTLLIFTLYLVDRCEIYNHTLLINCIENKQVVLIWIGSKKLLDGGSEWIVGRFLCNSGYKLYNLISISYAEAQDHI